MFLGDIMGNKGFTLVELLATVVILGLVLGIGTYSVVGTINNAKNKNEEIFVDRISEVIYEYIELKGLSLGKIAGREYNFDKCLNSDCSYKDASVLYELNSINISTLVSEGLIDGESMINPANKKECFDGVDPLVRIFKDSDYVYYYYVDLRGSNTSCEVSDKNGIINTLSDEAKEKVGL